MQRPDEKQKPKSKFDEILKQINSARIKFKNIQLMDPAELKEKAQEMNKCLDDITTLFELLNKSGFAKDAGYFVDKRRQAALLLDEIHRYVRATFSTEEQVVNKELEGRIRQLHKKNYPYRDNDQLYKLQILIFEAHGYFRLANSDPKSAQAHVEKALNAVRAANAGIQKLEAAGIDIDPVYLARKREEVMHIYKQVREFVRDNNKLEMPKGFPLQKYQSRDQINSEAAEDEQRTFLIERLVEIQARIAGGNARNAPNRFQDAVPSYIEALKLLKEFAENFKKINVGKLSIKHKSFIERCKIDAAELFQDIKVKLAEGVDQAKEQKSPKGTVKIMDVSVLIEAMQQYSRDFDVNLIKELGKSFPDQVSQDIRGSIKSAQNKFNQSIPENKNSEENIISALLSLKKALDSLVKLLKEKHISENAFNHYRSRIQVLLEQIKRYVDHTSLFPFNRPDMKADKDYRPDYVGLIKMIQLPPPPQYQWEPTDEELDKAMKTLQEVENDFDKITSLESGQQAQGKIIAALSKLDELFGSLDKLYGKDLDDNDLRILDQLQRNANKCCVDIKKFCVDKGLNLAGIEFQFITLPKEESQAVFVPLEQPQDDQFRHKQ